MAVCSLEKLRKPYIGISSTVPPKHKFLDHLFVDTANAYITQEFIRRRDLSGGMGADKDEGGDAGGGGKDGVHKWDFCMGDLSLMLWDDLNQIMGDEGATTDTIFADNGGLASTSVKGGVGIQSADGKTPGDASGKHRAGGKRKQAQQASDDRQETMVSVRKLLETLTETESKEASARGGGGSSAAVADPLTAVEDLVKKAEDTRKTLADLDDGAPEVVRSALQRTLDARQRAIVTALEACEELRGEEVTEEHGV